MHTFKPNYNDKYIFHLPCNICESDGDTILKHWRCHVIDLQSERAASLVLTIGDDEAELGADVHIGREGGTQSGK